MGVGDQEGAKDGVHDRVEGASGEGSDGEGDQTDADGAVRMLVISESLEDCSCVAALGGDVPLECPVVASLRGVRAGDGNGVVHYHGGSVCGPIDMVTPNPSLISLESL